jgi:hypothetical protein
MAQFQLFKGNKPVGGRFDNPANPHDVAACVELLRAQAIGNNIPVSAARLVSYERGKTREYRAT